MCRATQRAAFRTEGRRDCSHLPARERCEECRPDHNIVLDRDECRDLMRAADWFTDHLCITPGEPAPILSAKRKLEAAAALV